jgi:hypothetical protein
VSRFTSLALADMPLLRLFPRLRNALRLGAADPARHFGATFEGIYEPSNNHILGYITDPSEARRYPPSAINVLLGGEAAGATTEFNQAGRGWRFKVAFLTPITAQDVLHERIKVVALDQRGGRSELKIDGAVQLSYVREALAPPSETELLIEFGEGGNSLNYVRDGWSGQEQQHTWTDGHRSTIALPFGLPASRYAVEILAWPFVVPEKIPAQTMHATIADTLLKTFHVIGGQNLLEFEIPSELSQAGEAIISLDLPVATRPSDVTSTPDGRRLAFAFRRLKLKRYLGADTERRQ